MKRQGTGVREQGSGVGPKDRVPQLPTQGPGNLQRWHHLTGPALILLAAAVAVLPQLVRGNSCGHDFDFHLVSWFDCLNAWRHGIPYPHWSPSANFGAGEPRFVFYPPLTWMLGAALGLVMAWQSVPVAMTFLLLGATGLATRALARPALPADAATLAGCAAIFSGYALFTAYERSAFGELTGGFWMPLLLLLALRDRNPSGGAGRRALDGSAAPLALVVAGAWLSNVPVGVMTCYLLAAVALLLAALRRSWAPVLRGLISGGAGLGLSAIFLVPAVFEQRWVEIRQLVEDPGEKIENSWLFARHADPALDLHDLELHRVSLIAVTMVAVALIGLLIAWKRGKLPASRSWWIPLAVMPLAILVLQLPLSLPLWNLLPKLRYLQFPWRWLVVLEAPMGIFFAAAVWPTKTAPRWLRVAIVGVCSAIFLWASAGAGRLFFQQCDEEDNVAAMVNVFGSGAGFAGTDEYAPPGADDSMVAIGLPDSCLVSDPSVELGKKQEDGLPAWAPGQGTCEAAFPALPESLRVRHEDLRFSVHTAHPGYLVLRRRSYPAWRVRVNGQDIANLPLREDGLLAVPVPQGPVDLTVDWIVTPDVVAGLWLSVLAFLLLTGLCLLERRLNRTGLS